MAKVYKLSSFLKTHTYPNFLSIYAWEYNYKGSENNSRTLDNLFGTDNIPKQEVRKAFLSLGSEWVVVCSINSIYAYKDVK